MEFTSYDKALDWIHGTLRLGIKPGLSRMEKMLDMLGHPEKETKWIHVAGTNGKGSTLTFLRSVLEAEGYRIGTFTSPYIERFNERISVNNEPISDDMILKLANRVAPLASELAKTDLGPPSEFEIITTMMFLYFADYDQIDFGIIEVGLGGRLDSTNVLTPLISVITTIGLDHMEFLGNSLEEIAFEKGGIIKQSVPVISGVTQPNVIDVLQKLADKENAPFYYYGKDFNSKNIAKNAFTFYTEKLELPDLVIGLKGHHQIQNASVAIQTLLILKEEKLISLNKNSIYQGLEEAFWAGRLETIQGMPDFVLDGAHNPEGIQALMNHLKGEEHVELLISILSDKDYGSMIQSLKKLQQIRLHLTTFDFPRSFSKEDVRRISKEYGINAVPNWKEFISEKQATKSTSTVYISGSLYFISEVRKFLLNKN